MRAAEDYWEVVDARGPELLGIAAAVTGDASAARRLVRDVLLRLRREWSDPDGVHAPAASALADLVAHLATGTGGAQRSPAGSTPAQDGPARDGPPQNALAQNAPAQDAPAEGGRAQSGPGQRAPAPDPAPDDPDPVATEPGTSEPRPSERALTAYDRLDPRERTVLALSSVAGLTDTEIGAALGVGTSTVEDVRDAAESSLVAALGVEWPGHGWVLHEVESALVSRADALGDGGVRADLETALRVRRRRIVVGAAAVGVLGIGAAIGGRARQGGQAPPQVSAADPRWGQVSTWPARGRLARDPRVLASARGQRVVWADTIDGRVYAVCTMPGAPAQQPQLALHAGPRPDGLALAGLADDTGGLACFVAGSGRDARVVVLAPPGVTGVAAVTRVLVTAEGRPSAPRVHIGVQNGVGMLPSADVLPAAIRVGRDELRTAAFVGPEPGGAPCTRCTAASLGTEVRDGLREAVSRATGTPRSLVVARTVHEGEVDRRWVSGRGPVRAVVATATIPDGGTIRRTVVRSGSGELAVLEDLVALPRDAGRVPVTVSLPIAPTTERPGIGVISRVGVTAELRQGDARVGPVVGLQRRQAVLPTNEDPQDVEVVVRGRDGAVVGRGPAAGREPLLRQIDDLVG